MLAAAPGGVLPCGAQEPVPLVVGVVGAAPGLPASPAELFSALAKEARPQWRQYFRGTVLHAGQDRFQLALSLGAVCADCYLAAEARDAQQVLNLLTDMASLEMSLSIARQAGGARQKFTELAEAGDWAGVRTEIRALMTVHEQSFAAQQDDLLAELERTGLWLRAFHIGSRYSSRQPPPPGAWTPAMFAALQQSVARVVAGHESKTLKTLSAGLESLHKTWSGSAPAADNVAGTLKTLDTLMVELIGDTPATTPGSTP